MQSLRLRIPFARRLRLATVFCDKSYADLKTARKMFAVCDEIEIV